ncbi:hypothetical protein GCM10011360_02190 [Primorskyibacter flagellatus]|uniref:Ice-binding protein C-terminal domain-containing protein n=1 Tax=Primorskyibacter flagellatus TaxID=1387277 RepID=A0A916ZWJ8_9RHOB|nr:PEP-CTERM sorting domain-containing protein [Primorskyibacter flagellatus]GGE16960.1 hypothetical protein GCM10011360_02190 [Primorskyibacter flagellatus]
MFHRLCLLPFVMLAPCAGLAATVHTDLASFLTAAPGAAVETFESLCVGEAVTSLPTPHYDFGLLGNGQDPVGYAQSNGGTVSSGVRTIVNSGNALFPGAGPIVVAADAGYEITGFGYWNTGGDDTTRLTAFVGGASVLSEVSAFGAVFLGFAGMSGVSSLSISGETGNGWFSIDDMWVETAAMPAVPLPATSVLLLAALGAVGAAAHRKRPSK